MQDYHKILESVKGHSLTNFFDFLPYFMSKSPLTLYWFGFRSAISLSMLVTPPIVFVLLKSFLACSAIMISRGFYERKKRAQTASQKDSANTRS